jgi:hypothetical protein
MKTSKNKKHADFRSPYRRSSNFGTVTKKEHLKITKKGVKIKEDSNN